MAWAVLEAVVAGAALDTSVQEQEAAVVALAEQAALAAAELEVPVLEVMPQAVASMAWAI